VDNLPSLAAPGGFAATGLFDVSVLGRNRVYGVIGNDPPLASQEELGEQAKRFGRTFFVRNSQGAIKINADITQYEIDNNPDGGLIDSNPYALLAVDGKRIVADAGGNSLLEVKAADQIKTLAVFPNRLVDAPPFLGLPPGAQIPMQSVPNSVTKGPDGSYYVGELTGFPFPVGGARVYKVDKNGGTPEVYAEGFTNIIDVTFDKQGNLYVLEITKNGLLQAEGPGGDPTSQLTKIAPDGTRTVLASAGLAFASGVAVAPDGEIYVTNFGIFPGQGQVVKINQ
ncbi:MAG: ScyD/ScyE family protein, partial [Chloroflexales bacterium]|nr:ScyD/ScyE family protein [Chloroflexales bacterium]